MKSVWKRRCLFCFVVVVVVVPSWIVSPSLLRHLHWKLSQRECNAAPSSVLLFLLRSAPCFITSSLQLLRVLRPSPASPRLSSFLRQPKRKSRHLGQSSFQDERRSDIRKCHEYVIRSVVTYDFLACGRAFPAFLVQPWLWVSSFLLLFSLTSILSFSYLI